MTSSTTTNKKTVSFDCVVDMYEYSPITDSGTKSKLYYTDHELKMMKIEAKSMVLERYIQEQQLQLARIMKQNSELISCQLKTTDEQTTTSISVVKRPVTPDEEIESIWNCNTHSIEKQLNKRPVTPDYEIESVQSNKRMRFLPVPE